MFVNDKNNKPKYVQLYEHIIHDISHQHYKTGDKLPSIRQISKDMHLSRTTVENAYNQLVLEGYIYNKPQSGYYVSALEESLLPSLGDKQLEEVQDHETSSVHYVDEALFDIGVWKKYMNRTLINSGNELHTKGNSTGEEVLKEEIKKYLYRNRGVVCQTKQIIIGAGVQSLLFLLCHVLKRKDYKTIACEEPGFTEPHWIFDHAGFHIMKVPVHRKGLDLGKLKDSGVSLAYVSPSHQFPTGAVMPIANRLKLIEWSKRSEGLIIEDDYDSELTYNSQPVPSLQSLDHGKRVVYLGSLSTVFLSSLRISYMVVPEMLLEEIQSLQQVYNPTVSKIEQMALAMYMKDGELDKHMRRIKKLFYKKNERLLQCINNYLSPYISEIYPSSGVHILLALYEDIDLQGLLNELHYKKSKLLEIIQVPSFSKGQVLIKYRDIPLQAIDETIKELGLELKRSKKQE